MFEYSSFMHRQNLCICILKLIQGLLINKLNENIYNSEVKEKQISKYWHEYVCIIYMYIFIDFIHENIMQKQYYGSS